MPPLRFILLAVTFLLLGARSYAVERIGFGDSEALYASYALHPQPAYLDHPGLIGMFARGIAHGAAPTPELAHAYTTILATLVPFALLAAARAAGASFIAAVGVSILTALVPEIAVGLFAMTPDLLLAFAWIGALGFAAAGLRAPATSARAAWFLAIAGLACGIGAAAKISALLLFVALVVTYANPVNRAHARTIWPWVGLAAGALVFAPVAMFEARTGFPMLTHRLVDTQHAAGVSLRNLGALVFGQLAYLSPLVAIALFFVVRDLVRVYRSPERDGVDVLLLFTFAIPAAALIIVALVSRVAEPHWLAPPLLALPIHFARRATRDVLIFSRRFSVATAIVAAAFTAFVYAWVLVPNVSRFAPANLDPRYDISNELYGWPRAITMTRSILDSQHDEPALTVVGPHWTICAQLHAALGAAVPVGCDTEITDDFDTWTPRATWRDAEAILYVTDNRFPDDAATRFPDRAVDLVETVRTFRDGHAARTFHIAVLRKRART